MSRRHAARAVVIALPGIAALALALQRGGDARLLLSAGAIAVLPIAWRRMSRGDTWELGGDSEVRVARALGPLQTEGWVIVHDVMRDRGNIDHVIAGPGGVFTIETKTRTYQSRGLGQAWWHARWLSGRVGVRARPLLCLVERDVPPYTQRGVVVLSAGRLADYLRAQPPVLLSPDTLEAVLALDDA